MAVALIASIVFGTMPAWQATSIGDVITRIREEGGSTTSDPKRQRMRSILIVAETTLAVVLLVGAGLLARSFDRLLSVDLGFSADAVQTFSIALPDARSTSNRLQRQQFVETLLERTAANPNVESAGAIFGLPLSNARFGISTSTRDGVTLSDDEQDRLTLQVRLVTPDYFKTMGIPIVKGRGFTAGDRLGAQPVAMVNETGCRARVARSGRHGPSPRDRHALRPGRRARRRHAWSASSAMFAITARRRRCRRRCTLPHAQWPVGDVTIVAKARNGDPSSLVQPLRALLQDLDPDVPMFAVRSMDQVVGERRRAAAALPGADCLVRRHGDAAGGDRPVRRAGLCGRPAHARDRHPARAWRQAWRGPADGDDAGRDAWRSLAWRSGLAPRSSPAARCGRSCSRSRRPTRFTYVMVGIGLLIVALLASWIPARRASRIDPLTALRHD